LLEAFRKTSPQSKEFYLRLLELLAVSCHKFAVEIFQLDDVTQRHKIYDAWRDSPRDMTKWDSFRDPTVFSHGPYIAVDQYPNGAADSVGYWVEARTFGSVVVFDRGEDGTAVRNTLSLKQLAVNETCRVDKYTSMDAAERDHERYILQQTSNSNK
jgi:hypothetical protein